MNNRKAYAIMLILLAFLMVLPVFGQDNDDRRGNNRGRNQGNYQRGNNDQGEHHENEHPRTGNNDDNYQYQYHGQYRNFDNFDHDRRYFYNDRYYTFPQYYRFYYHEGNTYTYEGPYDRYSNIFIFTDKYGNEFDLYIPPSRGLPAGYSDEPLYVGDSFNMRVRPYRWYPSQDDLSLGLSLNFGWGAINLQKGKYFDMHSSPDLVNYDGQLYLE